MFSFTGMCVMWCNEQRMSKSVLPKGPGLRAKYNEHEVNFRKLGYNVNLIVNR